MRHAYRPFGRSAFGSISILALLAIWSCDAAQAQTQLPQVTVEGATLAVKPKPSPATSTQALVAPSNAGGASGGSTPSEPVTGISADTVGNAVSVITGDELRQSQVRNVVDALQSMPGVAVARNGSIGSATSVFIRGAPSTHTLVVIDGIVANTTTDGGFDFSDLSTDNIERIEVIRGPQSGLYGSAAVGGVINIVTRDGKGPPSVTVRSEVGSFATRSNGVSASGGTDAAYGTITYQRMETAGFNISPLSGAKERDGTRLETLSSKVGFKLNEEISANFSLRNMHKWGDRDGFGGPEGSLATATDDLSFFTSDIWMLGANLRWDMLGGALSHVVHADSNRTSRQDIDLGEFGPFFSRNLSEARRLSYLATYRFDTPDLLWAKHSVSSLIEKTNEAFTPEGDLNDGIRRDRSRQAFVGEYAAEYFNRFNVTGTIRRDDNSGAQEDFTTWRSSASLRLPELSVRPHASVGTGVKFPSMFELFGTVPRFFIPNPNLQPETSTGWDAGIEVTVIKGFATVDLTYFQAELENKIVTQGFPGTALNLPGISKREGLEVEARFKVRDGLLLTGAYTYLEARDPDGLSEIRRPPHSGRIDAVYTFDQGRGTLKLGAAYVGERVDSAFRVTDGFGTTVPERVDLSDYWLGSVAASYKLTKELEVFGRVENAFNAHYQEIYGFQTGGIAAYAGLKLKFDAESVTTKPW